MSAMATGGSDMKIFKVGDRVRIVEISDDGKPHWGSPVEMLGVDIEREE